MPEDVKGMQKCRIMRRSISFVVVVESVTLQRGEMLLGLLLMKQFSFKGLDKIVEITFLGLRLVTGYVFFMVITQFLKMETLFDDSVNEKVELHIERGGKSVVMNLVVQDLRSISPNYFLEVSGAMIHPLSYQQGHELELLVGTDMRDGNGTTRVIIWCGCIVQDPYLAVRALGFLPEEGHGAYVAR